MKDSSPKEVIIGVGRRIDEFVGDTDRFDDTTMMCVKYNGKQ